MQSDPPDHIAISKLSARQNQPNAMKAQISCVQKYLPAK